MDASRLKRRTQVWARRLHVYTSMVALVIVLFFGLTGLTLNHPTWTFGDGVDRTTEVGTFPFTVVANDTGTGDSSRSGTEVDYLSMAEYVRSGNGVRGTVDSFGLVGDEGSIVFKNPGYSAELTFTTGSPDYRLTVEQQGFLAVMNDLHKGRDAGTSWRWLIDLSAAFLVVISLTGLAMQLFLRRNRTSALITATIGGALSLVLVVLALI